MSSNKTHYQFSEASQSGGLSSGDHGSDVSALQSFLAQAGYLGPWFEVGRMCKDTCRAVRAFQENYQLANCSGEADPDTLTMVQRPRCGVPDRMPGSSNPALAPFQAAGDKYNKTNLTYAFQNLTPDVPGDAERQIIRQAFDAWAAVTPLRFTEVTPAAGPDFPIGWFSGPHGDGEPFDGTGSMQGNTLAHAFFPPPRGGPFAGAMHFDEAEDWIINGTNGIRLLNVAIHEIGHLLGLGHSNNQDAIMFAFYSPEVDSLRPDDIAGIQFLYGPPPVDPEPPTGGQVTGQLSGTDDRDVWTISLSTGAVTVGLAGPDDADFDLYLKAGSAPTTRDFDVRGYTPDADESIRYDHPGGTLYMAVESYRGSGDYTLTVRT